jgi:hypothetical protein
LTGCGWCFTPSGCQAAASGCSSFVTGTCNRPCPARDNCQMCLDGTLSCDWCAAGMDSPSNGVCGDRGSCATTTVSTLRTADQCPARPQPNPASMVEVKLSLVAALLSLFFFF